MRLYYKIILVCGQTLDSLSTVYALRALFDFRIIWKWSLQRFLSVVLYHNLSKSSSTWSYHHFLPNHWPALNSDERQIFTKTSDKFTHLYSYIPIYWFSWCIFAIFLLWHATYTQPTKNCFRFSFDWHSVEVDSDSSLIYTSMGESTIFFFVWYHQSKIWVGTK